MMRQPRISRREWMRCSALAAAGVCLCGVAAASENGTSCGTPELPAGSYLLGERSVSVDLSKATPLGKVGGAAVLRLASGEDRLILIRSGRRTYHAVSGLCTHARQVLSYIPERRLLMCNGFNHSLFGLDGRLFKGPAEEDLAAYPVVRRGEWLEIGLQPGRAA